MKIQEIMVGMINKIWDNRDVQTERDRRTDGRTNTDEHTDKQTDEQTVRQTYRQTPSCRRADTAFELDGPCLFIGRHPLISATTVDSISCYRNQH